MVYVSILTNFVSVPPTLTRNAWCHIAKTNGCHCHKTEIEGIKETPVLPDDEDGGPSEVEQDHGSQASNNHQ